MIIFGASAYLRSAQVWTNDSQHDPYLISGEPSPENVLAALSKVKLASGQTPSLSSSRLGRFGSMPDHDSVQHSYLHSHVPDPIPAFPAISCILRHLQPRLHSAQVEMTVVLDLQITPFSQEQVTISDISVWFADGHVQDLGKGLCPKLPLKCSPRDNFVYLYRLTAEKRLLNHQIQSTANTLDVTIKACVLASFELKPEIDMQWKTSIEFAGALSNLQGLPLPSPHVNNTTDEVGLGFVDLRYGTVSEPVFDSHLQDSTTDANRIPDSRIRFSIKGPAKAYRHQEFGLQVFILNSGRNGRHLELYPLGPSQLRGQKTAYDPAILALTSSIKLEWVHLWKGIVGILTTPDYFHPERVIQYGSSTYR